MQNRQDCFGISTKQSPPNSFVFVGGNPGTLASVATTTAMFTNLRTQIGRAITYISSTSLGSQMLINETGVYYFRASWVGNNIYTGLVVNNGSRTSAPNTLSYATGLRSFATSQPSGGLYSETDWIGLLQAGDIVTVLQNAVANSDTGDQSHFQGCRISV